MYEAPHESYLNLYSSPDKLDINREIDKRVYKLEV